MCGHAAAVAAAAIAATVAAAVQGRGAERHIEEGVGVAREMHRDDVQFAPCKM